MEALKVEKGSAVVCLPMKEIATIFVLLDQYRELPRLIEAVLSGTRPTAKIFEKARAVLEMKDFHEEIKQLATEWGNLCVALDNWEGIDPEAGNN